MDKKRWLAALVVPMLLSFFTAAAQDVKQNSNREVKSSAQKGLLSGLVLDGETNTPLEGVSVQLMEGTKKTGTVTTKDGSFALKAKSPNNLKTANLLFSYAGYNNVLLPLNGNLQKTLTIKMVPRVTDLNDVVVIGYGTQKKSLLTGSVSKLENKNLDEIPTSRLDNALEGKIAGVVVQQVDNEAGAAPKIQVRGTSSINADANPLVVVDGTPVPDGLEFVNSFDVKSIEVLKDAASSAIYGSRGANGVILVTTKSGSIGKPKYSLKVYSGLKKTYETYPIMSFSDYARKLYKEADLRADDPTVPDNKKNLISSQEKAAYIIEDQLRGAATDWQQEALRDAGIYNVQLGISGGKSDLRYYVSGNYQKDQGQMKFSQNEKASVKATLTGKLSPKISFNVSFNPSYAKRNIPGANYTDYTRFYSFLPVYQDAFTTAFIQQNSQWADVEPGDWAQARHFNGLPYEGYMPDGSYWKSSGVVSPFNTSNNTPLSIAARINRFNKYYRMLSSGYMSYAILPGLDFKSSVSAYYNQTENTTLTLTDAKKDGNVNTGEIKTTQYIDLLWENTLNYEKRLNQHHFNIMLGYTAEKTMTNTSAMFGENFPTDNFQTLNQAGTIDQSKTYTLKDQVGLVSYLGRILYDYKSKYLFAASLRSDGSSYFDKGRKYGWFPSISGGWVASSEQFMKSINWISNLKLRLSYGATGNNKIPSFAYEDLLYPSNYDFGEGTGSVILGLSPNADILANPEITWERTFEYNAGIDLGVLDNRLTLSVDYYSSKTDQLLLQQATMSFSGSNEFWNNAGSVRNKGLELSIHSVNINNKHFNWSTDLNISGNRNKLESLGEVPFLYNYGERNEIYAAIVGQTPIQFFGYKTDGIWLSQDEIDAAKDGGLISDLPEYFQPGGLKLVDVNKDNKIDASDRVAFGNPFPDFTWGFTNSFRGYGVDLSIFIQGVQGGNLINGNAFYNETKKFDRNFNNDNRWVSAAHPGDGKTPYFTNGVDMMLTDYVMESATYAALRNVIIGYTFPEKWIKKAKISSLRVYASADNLLYITGSSYRGINPESRVTSNAYSSPLVGGYQRGSFPMSRTFTLGLDLSF